MHFIYPFMRLAILHVTARPDALLGGVRHQPFFSSAGIHSLECAWMPRLLDIMGRCQERWQQITLRK